MTDLKIFNNQRSIFNVPDIEDSTK